MEPCSSIADIGCDHALLDIYLSKENIIKKSFALDITKGALNQADKNIRLYNAKNIETRLSKLESKIAFPLNVSSDTSSVIRKLLITK